MKNRLSSFQKTNAMHTAIMMLLSPQILLAAIPMIFVIIRDFFYLQTNLVPKRKRPPFVNIDHPIDNNIPFSPQWAQIYISFIGLWVFTVTWMFFTFKRKSIPHIVKSLREVKLIYLAAGSVYRIIQSTTSRPAPVKGDKILSLIHKMDPHLNCMPSLHVMMVTWSDFALTPRIEALASETLENNEMGDIKAITDFIKKRAHLITESILYMKQHSINCIPAALYVMKCIFPGFEEQYGKYFINQLLKESLPPVKERDQIIYFMNKLYDRFNNDKSERDFKQVLIDFLESYPKQYR